VRTRYMIFDAGTARLASPEMQSRYAKDPDWHKFGECMENCKDAKGVAKAGGYVPCIEGCMKKAGIEVA